MSHWEFLESKVGPDVVRYIIQPFLLPSARPVILAKREFLRHVLRMRYNRGKREDLMILPVLNALGTDWLGNPHHLRKYTDHHAAAQCRDCLAPVCTYCGDNACRVDMCNNLIYCKLCTLKRKQERRRIINEKNRTQYRAKYAEKLAAFN